MKRGFTLIELLIVVAIIAILAAIAVPNFLQAQTRAKISRVNADQRSIATALESYITDWNKPPIDESDLNKIWGPGVDNVIRRAAAYSALTTPVDFLTSIPRDPFIDKGIMNKSGANPQMHLYRYFTCAYADDPLLGNNNKRELKSKGYVWALCSSGPMRDGSGAFAKVLLGQQQCAYDSTNGTASDGWIILTNKGMFTAAE